MVVIWYLVLDVIICKIVDCYNSDKEDLNFKQNSFKFSSGAKLRMIFDP